MKSFTTLACKDLYRLLYTRIHNISSQEIMEIQASLPCFCVIIKTLFGAKIPPPHLKISNKVNVPHAKL